MVSLYCARRGSKIISTRHTEREERERREREREREREGGGGEGEMERERETYRQRQSQTDIQTDIWGGDRRIDKQGVYILRKQLFRSKFAGIVVC